jgi:hypothetical protein
MRPSSISMSCDISVTDGSSFQSWFDLFALGEATDTMSPL